MKINNHNFFQILVDNGTRPNPETEKETILEEGSSIEVKSILQAKSHFLINCYKYSFVYILNFTINVSFDVFCHLEWERFHVDNLSFIRKMASFKAQSKLLP